MQRNIIEQLRRWKDKKNRKPLVLAGARQVGKTYILKEFGKTEFSNVAYINCDDNELAKDLLVAENAWKNRKVPSLRISLCHSSSQRETHQFSTTAMMQSWK